MDITVLIHRAAGGDSKAREELIEHIYPELRRLAHFHMHSEKPGRWEQTTALVHECYLRMAQSNMSNIKDRAHFLGVASHVMRQVLVDLARKRNAQKRDARMEVTFDPALGNSMASPSPRSLEALIDLDTALDKLAKESPRRAKFVEMRFFGGMTTEEIAEALSLSVNVIRHDLRFAQAWLARELSKTST